MASRMVLGGRDGWRGGRSLTRPFSTILIEDSGFGLTKNELANNSGTISIEDSGFGMTKNELVNKFRDDRQVWYQGVLGGHECQRRHFHHWAFRCRLLLGQSVSDKFRVVSKSFEDVQYIWESAAGVSFTIQKARHEDHLSLEEIQSEFLEERRLKDLVSDNTQQNTTTTQEHTRTHKNTQEQQEQLQHNKTTTQQHNNTTTLQQQHHYNNTTTTQQQHTTTTQASVSSVPTFVASPFLMDPSEQPVIGAAQRRKQRRLRSWWRHEQQSFAAALATFTHHSALRGQKKVRAGEEES